MADHEPDVIGKETGAPLHFPTKDDLAHTKSMAEVIHNARLATDKEHKMTLWQGIKLYPKAVGWSLLISTCIAMEGYDVCLLSNFCK
jgi:MFS transporter, SP family, general alpha glucoside:H+ symporter